MGTGVAGDEDGEEVRELVGGREEVEEGAQ